MSEKYSKDWWAERLDFIRAFVDGDDVQYISETIDKHTFSGDPEDYRIKPKPVAPDEVWVNVHKQAEWLQARSTKQEAIQAQFRDAKAIAVRYVRAED